MGTKKKTSELATLVFNLQWRNKTENGGGKSNIIGIYDTPTATKNFETFKSYLLKNSGVAGNDARVAYVADDGSEWSIDSPEWFEFALNAFRLKAKLGEVINLKLDKISRFNMAKKQSSDVETQFNFENVEISNGGAPPEWFLLYMTQLKQDIANEVAYAVDSKLQATKEKSQHYTQISGPSKIKYEPKRGRKCLLLDGTIEARDFLKSKVERKLEHKLEKLEAKTRKYKEKKQAVLNKFDKENHEIEETSSPQDNTKIAFAGINIPNNCAPVHMLGGETYVHKWNIKNTGTVQWTEKTEIRLTWGSAEFIPSKRSIPCPPLKPGECCSVVASFIVPTKPGSYESYWNFYNDGERFGNWLCCGIIVDDPLRFLNTDCKLGLQDFIGDCATLPVVMIKDKGADRVETESKGKRRFESVGVEKDEGAFSKQINNLTVMMQDCKMDSSNTDLNLNEKVENLLPEDVTKISSTNSYGIEENELIVDLTKNKTCVAIEHSTHEILSNMNSQSDINGEQCMTPPFSIVTPDDNTSLVLLSDEGSNASIANEGFDFVNASLCKEDEDEQEDTGYVYIVIDGNKLAVPKYILRPEFLSSAEEAPVPSLNNCDTNDKLVKDKLIPIENLDIPQGAASKLESEIHELEQNLKEANSYILRSSSIISNDGSSQNSASRLFIFPQNDPGFEVVYPIEDSVHKPTSIALPGDSNHVYTWANSQSMYNYAPDVKSTTCYKIDSNCETHEHVPNYQQTIKVTPNLSAENLSTQASTPVASASQAQASVNSPERNLPVHILPENLVSGAVNVASSAINTARSVINMIVPPKPEPGRWVNGHWVSSNPESTRAKNLIILTDMGFWDPDLNATLLARYDDDVNKVVAELLNLS